MGAPDHVLACAKHFAGYGAADGGRDYDSSYIAEEQFRKIYLPPFKAAIDAGVGSVMSAYMDLNDVPASGNRWLLTDVLRHDLGFQRICRDRCRRGAKTSSPMATRVRLPGRRI